MNYMTVELRSFIPSRSRTETAGGACLNFTAMVQALHSVEITEQTL
jgi:hypothetical protein